MPLVTPERDRNAPSLVGPPKLRAEVALPFRSVAVGQHPVRPGKVWRGRERRLRVHAAQRADPVSDPSRHPPVGAPSYPKAWPT